MDIVDIVMRVRGAAKAAADSDKVAGAITRVGESATAMRDRVNAAGRVLGVVMAGATAAVGRFGFAYNKMQDSQMVAFTTLLGSQRAAIRFMGQIRQLALESPVLDPETTGDAARLLMSYGINAKKVLPWVKAIGDMSASSGKSLQEVMPRAAMAIGQIASKGKMQSEELNQLAESVGLSRDRIRQALSMTRSEFNDLFSAGNNLEASKALPAILEAMTAQSAGAADRLAKTTAGKIDRAKEGMKAAAGEFTRPLYDELGNLAGRVGDILTSSRVQTVARSMGAGLMSGLRATGGAVRSVFGAVRDLSDAIDLPEKLAEVRKAVAGVKAAVTGGLAPGGAAGMLGFDIGTWGRTQITRARQVGAGIWASLVGGLAPGGAAGMAGFGIGEWLKGAVKDAREWIGQLLDAFKPAEPFLRNVLLPLIKGVAMGVIGGIVGAFKIAVPIIRVLATALGWVGTVLAPLKGLFTAVGVVLGFMFGPAVIGAVVRVLGLLGRAFAFLPVVLRILLIPLRVTIAVLRVLSLGVLAVVRVVGLVFQAFGRFIGMIASRFPQVPAMIGRGVRAVFGFLGSLAGRAAGAAGRFIGRFVGGVGPFGQRVLGVVRSGMGAVFRWLGSLGGRLFNAGKTIWGKITSGLKSALGSGIGFAADIANGLIDLLNDAIPNKIGPIGLPDNPIPPIKTSGKPPGMATGGVVRSPGVALIGERGPELLDFPRNARVTPLDHETVMRPPVLRAPSQPILVKAVVNERVLAEAHASIAMRQLEED